MSEAQVIISEHDGILEVVLNRPAKYNAINEEMRATLMSAVQALAERADYRVLLLRAKGKYFSAGADVSGGMSPEFDGSSMAFRQWYRGIFHPLFDAFEAVEKPVVVAHQGPCLGGALEMSLSCDFRLAAQCAYYSLPEINLGVIPGSGGTSRLTRLVGPHWSRWLAMAGQSVDADEALRMGLVHKVFPDETFEAEVWAFCRSLVALPPEALALAKLSIELATDLEREQARNIERLSNSILNLGREHQDRMASFQARQRDRKKN